MRLKRVFRNCRDLTALKLGRTYLVPSAEFLPVEVIVVLEVLGTTEALELPTS